VSENLFLPTKENGRAITFADRFPLCVSYPSPEFTPVVTFTYIDSEHKNLDAFIAHLSTYRPLFRQLPGFQFLYVSTAESQQKEATELFALFTEAKGLADLTRYFDLQTKWDNKQYGRLSEHDVFFMSEGRKRFTGDSIATLYYLWKRNQLPKDLQVEPASTSLPIQKILFRAVTVPGHDGIFGDNARRWSDGWQIRGTSGGSTPRKSPTTPMQSLERTADT
jgi:hypothetical protein